MNEIVLIESQAMRAEVATRTDVLDKVKTLALLPDDMHVTTEMVATYYGVSTATVDTLVRRHREEFASNGLRTLRGDELQRFKLSSSDLHNEDHWNRVSVLTLFTRCTVQNVGMLLVDSEVARAVRRELLDGYGTPAAAPELSLAEAERRLKALGAARRAGALTVTEVRKLGRPLLVAAGLADPLPTEEQQRAEDALRWVRRRHQPGDTFSLREMHQGIRGRAWVDTADDVKDALRQLAADGHVRVVVLPRTPGPLGGRPPGSRYQVLAEPGHLSLVRDECGGAS